jgi:SAM-dependent methyltransferase/Tfp pilus assembly protein PilF
MTATQTELRLRDAVAAFEDADTQRAATLARQVLSDAPERVEAWNLLALIADRNGRADEAVSILTRALKSQPDAVELLNTQAVLLVKLRRGHEAEAAWRKILSLDPGHEAAAANLAGFLLQNGRIADAEYALQAALSAAPGNAGYMLRLARILGQKGDGDGALALLERAAAITGRAPHGTISAGAPGHADVLTDLGILLFWRGDYPKAADTLCSAIEAGAGPKAATYFANSVSRAAVAEPRPDLQRLMIRALNEGWILPADLMRSAAHMLLVEPAFRQAARAIDENSDLLAAAPDVMNSPLLRTMLTRAIVTNPDLEKLLTALRSALLKDRERAAQNLEFAVCLAIQCFHTEYAFLETAAETAAVAELAQAPSNDAAVAVLAAYRPLYQLGMADELAAKKWAPPLDRLIAQQILAPREEQRLAKSIPALTPVTDPTSKAVQAQYRENPYPRWIDAPSWPLGQTLESWIKAQFPDAVLPPRQGQAALSVLVAGCGTGQEAIGASRRFANAKVLAVDLSLPSLAYARRKTQEMGISNINYAVADILEMPTLAQQFDIVESGGVLHHMRDPETGLRALTAVTKPGGLILLALYSETGRQDLAAAETFAERGKYEATPEGLRRFRHDIIDLPPDDPARTIADKRDDFYNLSMLRDMLFHVQEQRFTIPRVAAAIRSSGLELLGFATPPEIRQQFVQRFGAAARLADPEQWEIFERENPAAFAGMYHMLLCKPG